MPPDPASHVVVYVPVSVPHSIYRVGFCPPISVTEARIVALFMVISVADCVVADGAPTVVVNDVCDP